MGLEALLSSQIIGLSEAIDDRTAALLVAGTGITLTYNDGAGTLTIANTGLGGSTGSSDNRILRSDGTVGATVQASGATLDDSDNLTIGNDLNLGGDTIWRRVSGSSLDLIQSGASRARISNGEATFTGRVRLTSFNPANPDIDFVRNATGPSAEIRAAGGLRVRNSDGSAAGALNCGAITSQYGATGNDTVAITSVGTLAGQTNAEGTKWQLVTASGADSLRLSSTGSVQFNSTGNLNTGSIDASIRRNASGPTLDTWSAGGLRVRSADGSAAGALDCGAITASGTVTCQSGFELASRTKAAVLASSTAVNSGRFQLSDAGLIGREVYPDGTNWRYSSDDSIVT